MKNVFKRITVIDVIVGVVIILVLFITLGLPFCTRFAEDNITITITDKDIKRSGSEDDKYLIYTDNGTYEITDTIAYWRWDSSDLYGSIQVGETYNCTVAGWRIPLLSEYQNIITADKVKN